ncbi:MAG TPA: MBL fold metallo-hydrolase [Thermoanaerobaculia bacterium]|nr:MBL fold metallo-hydrolase [Thermoanaerobaculia bacterium]
MRAIVFLPLLLLLVPLAANTADTAVGRDPGPRVVVLGTVQDGGMPQAGCSCSHCAAARRDPSLRRHVASLAIDFPRTGHTYLVDATPDLGEQIEQVHGFRRHPEGKVDRAPFDGVLLTHAHIGHYLGLAFFGFESLNTQGLATWCSPRMAAYLRGNGPWSQLVRLNNLTLHEIELGKPFPLEEGVTVTALPVPHRDEYTDTLGFRIQGPQKTLFYVPDTDAWSTWKTPVTEVLKDVDYALLDGTFYSPDELPDRDVTKIKHPLITVSMDLLEPLVQKGRLQVLFTHLNHSNPALDAGGPARKAIEGRGFRVLAEGAELGL